MNWAFKATGGALGLGAALLLVGLAYDAARMDLERDIKRAKNPVK